MKTALRTVRPLLLAAVGLCATALPAPGQVVSGPTVDTKPEPFKVTAVTGDEAGQEVDYTALRKDHITIFLFVQADRWDRPTARYLKTLDEELHSKRKDVRAVAVWLTDDVAKSKDYLPKAQQSVKFQQTALTVFDGDRNEGPKNWGLNSDAHLTTVIVSGNNVDATFAYRSTNETDVPEVIKKLKPAAAK